MGQPRGPGVQHGVRDVLLPSGRHHSASTRLASRDKPGAQGQAGVGVGDRGQNESQEANHRDQGVRIQHIFSGEHDLTHNGRLVLISCRNTVTP